MLKILFKVLLILMFINLSNFHAKNSLNLGKLFKNSFFWEFPYEIDKNLIESIKKDNKEYIEKATIVLKKGHEYTNSVIFISGILKIKKLNIFIMNSLKKDSDFPLLKAFYLYRITKAEEHKNKIALLFKKARFSDTWATCILAAMGKHRKFQNLYNKEEKHSDGVKSEVMHGCKVWQNYM